MMHHENVARVYDGGTAPDGRPYFVMEYVKGEAITTFAIPVHDLLIDAPRGLGIKEIEFAPSIGSE